MEIDCIVIQVTLSNKTCDLIIKNNSISVGLFIITKNH